MEEEAEGEGKMKKRQGREDDDDDEVKDYSNDVEEGGVMRLSSRKEKERRDDAENICTVCYSFLCKKKIRS